ncbi:MAG: hypothetical protein L0211_20680, partial [Planctomycetaceae bacterium]|nr:hypothetical protein [Planctomycetaceae bacterium]
AIAWAWAAIGRAQEPPTAPVAKARLLTVELASGRKFTGFVDATTSDERLVLRFARGDAMMKRPIDWSRVVRASVDGVAIELGRLRETAIGMRSREPGARSRGPGAGGQEPASVETPIIQPRVTSVSFDARLANWDSDVETDGLLVEIYPLSDDGYIVPANGAVEVELFAPQKRVFHHAPLSGGDTLERVERWTQAIDAADFGRGYARLKLPFGAVHPEFDLDWIGVGLVHVRLVVPGDGVFENSVDGLRIRPYAPLRDRYEMNTGRRFAPTERVGRHD